MPQYLLAHDLGTSGNKATSTPPRGAGGKPDLFLRHPCQPCQLGGTKSRRLVEGGLCHHQKSCLIHRCQRDRRCFLQRTNDGMPVRR